MITLVYDIKPIPAPRPRVTRWGTYNDPKYTEFKNKIRDGANGVKKMAGAIKMQIFFQFKFPKSWTKRKKASVYRHTSRPDTDNLVKGIKDALNGIAYKDDSQVCDLDAVKVWGEYDRIIVEILEV